MSEWADDLSIAAYFAGARVAAGACTPPFHRPLTPSEQESFDEGYADHLDDREFAFAHATFTLPTPLSARRLSNRRSTVHDRTHDDGAMPDWPERIPTRGQA